MSVNKFLNDLFKNKSYNQLINKIIEKINRNQSNVFEVELLGITYLETQQFLNAIKIFEKLITEFPNFYNSYINLGIAYRKIGNTKKAIYIYENFIKNVNKNNPAIYNNLAVSYSEEGQKSKAIKNYNKAIQINKDYKQAYINLAKYYQKNGQLSKVKKIIQNGIKNCKSAKDKEHLYEILATHYIQDINKFKEGENIYQKLILSGSKSPDVFHNYGYYLQSKNRLNLAYRYIKKSLKLKYNFTEAHNSLGIIYYKKGKLSNAINCYRESLKIDKNNNLTKHNLGVAYIRKNSNLNIAWELREIRRRETEFFLYNKYKDKIWNGDRVKDLYIWNEQGVGDQILFLNTVILASKKVDKIYLHLDKRIIGLYQNFLKKKHVSNVKVLGVTKRNNNNKFKEKYIKETSAHIAVGSLPMFFLNNVENFKKLSFPYLCSNKEKFNLDKSKIHIGISWKTTNPDEQHRNISLDLLTKIFKNKLYRFHNLQFGNINKELLYFKRNNIPFVFNKNVDYTNNFEYLSQLINSMDCVITIQNTIAHLCGAMNKKFIILQQPNCRFNWGFFGNKTLWYPSAHVVRNNDRNIFANKNYLISTLIKKII